MPLKKNLGSIFKMPFVLLGNFTGFMSDKAFISVFMETVRIFISQEECCWDPYVSYSDIPA